MHKLKQHTQYKLKYINTTYNGWKNTKSPQVQGILDMTENFILGIGKLPYDTYTGKDMFSQELLTVLDRTTKGISWTCTTPSVIIGLKELLGEETNPKILQLSAIAWVGGTIFFRLNIAIAKKYKYKKSK